MILIERFSHGWFLKSAGFKCVLREKYGTAWKRCSRPHDRPIEALHPRLRILPTKRIAMAVERQCLRIRLQTELSLAIATAGGGVAPTKSEVLRPRRRRRNQLEILSVDPDSPETLERTLSRPFSLSVKSRPSASPQHRTKSIGFLSSNLPGSGQPSFSYGNSWIP